MNNKMMFLHALTPLHAGTGRGVGVIDLPIAREVATGHPLLPGSSLKGVLRDQCFQSYGEDVCNELFGSSSDVLNPNASMIQFSDQRLLLMPVRSLAGTFAWVTSPFVLSRFSREHRAISGASSLPSIPAIEETNKAFVPGQRKITLSNNGSEQIILEDLILEPETSEPVEKWAVQLGSFLFSKDQNWQTILKERLCLVHNDVFTFLLQTGTEINARIRLKDDSKTVQEGGLWYEEALPAESILSGLVTAYQIKKTRFSPDEALTKLEAMLNETGLVQVGGSATVGRGLCQLTLN